MFSHFKTLFIDLMYKVDALKIGTINVLSVTLYLLLQGPYDVVFLPGGALGAQHLSEVGMPLMFGIHWKTFSCRLISPVCPWHWQYNVAGRYCNICLLFMFWLKNNIYFYELFFLHFKYNLIGMLLRLFLFIKTSKYTVTIWCLINVMVLALTTTSSESCFTITLNWFSVLLETLTHLLPSIFIRLSIYWKVSVITHILYESVVT